MFVYKAEHGSAWSRFVNIHLTLRLICFDLVGGRFENLDCGVKEKQMVWFDVIFFRNFFSSMIRLRLENETERNFRTHFRKCIVMSNDHIPILENPWHKS